MERTDDSHIIIESNETVLCPDLFQESQRLTPTGKISHAKTRVYTQRYRKEWEQSPDFKGWLTSVAFQPTRAFCLYCKKNLHAHRLSLLKHTCTRKHQRAAQQHEYEMNEKNHAETNLLRYDKEFEHADISNENGDEEEDDEDDAEFEYVVERLDMDEEEEEEEVAQVEESKHEDFNNDDENDKQPVSIINHEDDQSPKNKRFKTEEKPRHRDTLAEAMAHVHGEYLDNSMDEQNNVEMELPKNEEKPEIEPEKSMKFENESKLITYQIASPQVSLSGDQSQISGAVSITPMSNKTFMLGKGKTVTLKAGGLPPGFVLSKVKGNLPTLLMASSKTMKQRPIVPKSPGVSSVAGQQESPAAVPGPSQQIQKEFNLTNFVRIKPCISTHVIDTSKGLPIGGLQVSLYKLMEGRWTFLNESTTAPNGRCTDLVDLKKSQLTAGRYKLHFDVDKYFSLRRIETMFPFIEVVFDVKNPTGNYHIPILLSPFSYTTYRGTDR